MHAFTILLALASLPGALSHGYMQGAGTGGSMSLGPKPWEQYKSDMAVRVQYTSDKSKTFALFSSDFNDADKMSCGPGTKTGAPSTIKVAAGESVDVWWAGSTGELQSFSKAPNGFFPFVHAGGPVIDYLASCEGDCSGFDASNAKWTKVAEFGVDMSQTISQELRGLMAAKPEVVHPTNGPGLWGMAKMIDDGSKWTLNIPADLAPGQYLWRNELGAVHSNPAQIYVGCVQIEVTGSGKTALPAGVTSDQLYTKDSLLGNFNYYTYDYSKPLAMPGPALWDGAGSSSSSTGSSSSGSSSSGSSTSGTDALDEPDTTSTAPKTVTSPKTGGSSSSGSSGSSYGSSGSSSSSGSSGSYSGSSGSSGSTTKSGKNCMRKRQIHRRQSLKRRLL